MLNDWGPHLFDQLLLLVPSPVVSVFGRLYSKIWSEEVEDHFLPELLFAGGLPALAEASNNHRLAQDRWCIVGTEGTLRVQGGGPDSWSSAVIRRASRRFPEETRYELPRLELSSGFYDEFVKALQAGTPLPVQPDQVLRVMEVIEAVRSSDAAGKSVVIRNVSTYG